MSNISFISSGAIINTSDYKTQGIPLIRIQNVLQDGIDFSSVKYVSEETFNKEKNAQINSGELLFGMSGTIGRVAVVQDNLPKCLLNQRIAKVYVKEDANNVFVQSILNSAIGINQFSRIGTGGIQINIGINDIENLKIPLPPRSTNKMK